MIAEGYKRKNDAVNECAWVHAYIEAEKTLVKELSWRDSPELKRKLRTCDGLDSQTTLAVYERAKEIEIQHGISKIVKDYIVKKKGSK